MEANLYTEGTLEGQLQEDFFDAVYRNDLLKVELLLLEHAGMVDINASNSVHKTALYLALDSDQSRLSPLNNDMARLLIKFGADVNRASYCSAHCSFEVPVVTAARRKNHDMVELLLEEKCELEGHGGTKEGKSALQWAASYGDIAMAKLLYLHGGDVNWIGPYYNSALHYATIADEKDMVKWLLKHDAEVSINGDGRSPLHIAAVRGNLTIVQHLVNHGCEIDTKDNFSFTPFSLACLRGHLAIIQYIMDNAPVTTEFNINDGLLRASDCGHLDVLQYLLDKGADVDATNNLGETALSIAARGQYFSVQLLLRSNARVNTVDKRGYTPLQHAILREQKDIAKSLIQHGAYLYSHSPTIDSPLQMCCTIANPMLIKCMIDAGCNLTRESWFTKQVIEEKLRDIDYQRSMRFYKQVSVKKDVWHWIMERMSQPPTMAEAARVSIRRQLTAATGGCSIFKAIHNLPLPSTVKQYLMMEDVF